LVIVSIIRSGLGNLPVLTEFTVEIAACGGNGKRAARRKHVEKWLFLNRVNMHCTWVAVNQRVIASSDVFPNLAISPLALVHLTGVRTEFAANTTIVQGGVKRRELATEIALFQAQSVRLGGVGHQESGFQTGT
jgi:hypothetical protein